jgi:DNA repair exonuclease SbcCD ATPase subunit
MNKSLLYVEVESMDKDICLNELNKKCKKYKNKNIRIEQKTDSWGDPYLAIMLGVTSEERDKWLTKLESELKPLMEELKEEERKLAQQQQAVHIVNDKLSQPLRIRGELLVHMQREKDKAIEKAMYARSVRGSKNTNLHDCYRPVKVKTIQ